MGKEEPISLVDAAEMAPDAEGQKRMMRLVAAMIENLTSKIVEGPVEDVQILAEYAWIVAYSDRLMHFATLLSGPPEVGKVARSDLIRRIQRLPDTSPNQIQLVAKMAASVALGNQVCCGMLVGKRRIDSVDVTIVYHPPTLELDEIYYILRQTAENSVRQRGP